MSFYEGRSGHYLFVSDLLRENVLLKVYQFKSSCREVFKQCKCVSVG